MSDPLAFALTALVLAPTAFFVGLIAVAMAFILHENQRSDSKRQALQHERRRAFRKGALRERGRA